MDNQRLIIWAIFGVLAWMTYQAWMQEYAAPPTQAPTEVAAPGEQLDTSLPALTDTAAAPAVPGELPSLEPQAPAPIATQIAAAAIQVTTDTTDLQISTAGGTLTSAELVNYPVAKDRPGEKINLRPFWIPRKTHLR